MVIDRSIQIRAPSCSLRPGQIVQSLKGSYGLTKGPRLWYPRARERLTGRVGPTELRCARAAFEKHDARGKLRVILTMHVDDALLFWTRSDPFYRRLHELINNQFDIKGQGDLNNPTVLITYVLNGRKQTRTSAWISWNRWKYQRGKP